MIHRVTAHPASGAGTKGRIGDRAVDISTETVYVKVGTADTDWVLWLSASASLDVQTATVGNAGAGEDTLHTFTLPADTLTRNQESLEIEYVLGFTANVNNKRVRAYFGAATAYDTGAVAKSGGSASLHIRLWRTSSTAQRMIATFVDSTDTTRFSTATTYGTASETLSGAVVIRVTGEGTADNDVVCRASAIRWVNKA